MGYRTQVNLYSLQGGVFSKNGWGGVRIPSPTNQSRALRPGFQVLILKMYHPDIQIIAYSRRLKIVKLLQ